MCYQLIERYSACRCLYYLHAVDKCASYGRRGHTATSREIAVGYACPSHGGDFQSKSPPIDEGDEATSDAASLFSVRSSASTSLSIPSEAGDKPVERLFRDLLTEPHLEHLFPQVVRISKTQEDAEQIISRFLKRFSHDLKSRSETVEHFQASRYVRQCRQDIARRIAECHSTELDEVREKDQASFVHQVKKALVENENDGDNEEIDILYDDLTEFLFSGPAFESFHGSIREFVDKSGAQSTNWLPDQYKWLYDDYLRCVNVINDLIGKYICPPKGRRRLWWTCVGSPPFRVQSYLTKVQSCGRRLHDDFRELRPGALNDLQDFLLSYLATPATRPDGFPRAKLLTLVMTLVLPASFVSALMSSGMFTWEIVHVKPEDRQKSGFASPWALYWVSVTGWALVFLLVLIEWLERQKLPVSTTATASPDPEAAQDGSSTNQSVEKQRSNLLGRFCSKGLPRHPQDTNGPDLTKCSIRNALPGGEETHRFLLLCIPFLKWGLKLQQPDVCRIHSDRDFFKLLRKAYLKHRVGKHWRWLRRVKQLDFCQVCDPHARWQRS